MMPYPCAEEVKLTCKTAPSQGVPLCLFLTLGKGRRIMGCHEMKPEPNEFSVVFVAPPVLRQCSPEAGSAMWVSRLYLGWHLMVYRRLHRSE